MNIDNSKINLIPGLSNEYLFGRDKDSSNCNLLVANSFQKLFFPSGRSAMGFLLANASPDKSEVLLPSYYCRTMVDPLKWTGRKPIFYKMTNLLDPDFEDLKKKVTDKTLAIVGVNFFGFFNNIKGIKKICVENGITFIEDNAHSLTFNENIDSDYMLTSLRKFLPIFDGGSLLVRNDTLGLRRRLKTSLKFNARSLKNTFENSSIISCRSKKIVTDYQPIASVAPPNVIGNQENGNHYDDSRFNQGSSTHNMSLISKLIYRLTNYEKIIESRRKNYKFLSIGLEGLKYIKPFKNSLEDCVCPVTFPVLIENKHKREHVYTNIRSSGINTWRWDDIEETECPVTNDYRYSLVQLPCNHTLNKQQLSYILKTLAKLDNEFS